MQKVTLARNAMATRFEFVLAGRNPVQLRAAGEEALDEIERIEAQLSLYQSGSEVAQVNAWAADRPVRVSPTVFNLISKARHFWELSGGAFDITIGPLVRCWGFIKGGGTRPADSAIASARQLVGTDLVELDSTNFTVRFRRSGMMLDLGSIGKGYALDQAVEILRDAGVENALLHGGTSTIYGLGEDPDVGPWKIVLNQPVTPNQPETPAEPLAVVPLTNQAMSVSAVWGKFFTMEGKTYGHVINPRTGWPAQNALLGCVLVESATESDALSTAVLLADTADLDLLSRQLPGLAYLQAALSETGATQIIRHKIR